MEMKTGKVLDEECNCYNEVYSDEVLYAAWAEAPREAANDPSLNPAGPAPLRASADAFMARLYLCQE